MEEKVVCLLEQVKVKAGRFPFISADLGGFWKDKLFFEIQGNLAYFLFNL